MSNNINEPSNKEEIKIKSENNNDYCQKIDESKNNDQGPIFINKEKRTSSKILSNSSLNIKVIPRRKNSNIKLGFNFINNDNFDEFSRHVKEIRTGEFQQENMMLNNKNNEISNNYPVDSEISESSFHEK